VYVGIQSLAALLTVGTEREEREDVAIPFLEVRRTPGIRGQALDVAVRTVVLGFGKSCGLRYQ
jgi:hypothetical protein